jgi:hypothetical protein
MTTYPTILCTSPAEIDAGREDFGVRDQKGRAIGYAWGIQRYEAKPYVRDPNPDAWCSSYWSLEFQSDVVFRAWSTVTRDGRGYGASMPYIHCATLEEVKAALGKRIAGARKRYTKQFAEVGA